MYLKPIIFCFLCLLFLAPAMAQKANNFDHSHQLFDLVLKNHTKAENHQTLFNYAKLKLNRKNLDNYLFKLKTLKKAEFKSFSKTQKLAFWINAYNAYTLDIVVRNYPLKSIKDISNGGLFSSFVKTGPWKIKFISQFGKKISLDNIEHDIIRKKFMEPRIHFAVNCASIGCPSLLPEAFVASRLESQLEKAAHNFLSNKKKNFVKNGKLFLSKIFSWYGDDFNKKFGSYNNYVTKFYKVDKKADVDFNDYDWKLNEFK